MKSRNSKKKSNPAVSPEEVVAAILPQEADKSENQGKRRQGLSALTRPTATFTQTLAHEIAKNLTAFGQMTSRPFKKASERKAKEAQDKAENPVYVDTSVLIDGRILPIINSGFFAGTLIIPEFILAEVQHIADSPDIIRRTKGRRGLDVVNKIKSQKANPLVKCRLVSEDNPEVREVDHKLVALAKKRKAKLLTVDFNLAQLARAQGVKVLSIHDLAQAMKAALVPGEEMTIRISHEGKEREQGVGYLDDGTMVVVDNTRTLVGHTVIATITKIHQTPAGQLFFARLK
ncbi:hypothetical protein A2Z33_03690 [Candidatus Gottesmanbacteria bacterium RBG_16_52_11]|uniref:TRAM domain-containing protein n=1 Tax=Candidatus Gottesmanbacteria bacterium RBG_16_52_11 TaxID=1798374 RepID=A0A1F5YVT0_9BACT|nr:MAG: hypothetical protein A2Z33_03690 [Candidatus Gottesmanbacteria bacterium RBG_16_52_11]